MLSTLSRIYFVESDDALDLADKGGDVHNDNLPFSTELENETLFDDAILGTSTFWDNNVNGLGTCGTINPGIISTSNSLKPQDYDCYDFGSQSDCLLGYIAYQDVNTNVNGPCIWPWYSPESPPSNISAAAELVRMKSEEIPQGHLILGFEEMLALREIAMPSYTSTRDTEQLSVKEDISINKRRKVTATTTVLSSSSSEEDKEDEDESLPLLKRLQRKRGHNAIEKRYRNKLNDKILDLDRCLPVSIPESGLAATYSREAADGQRRNTKSTILTQAVSHIKILEQKTRRLTLETTALNVRIVAFEKIALYDAAQLISQVAVSGSSTLSESRSGSNDETNFATSTRTKVIITETARVKDQKTLPARKQNRKQC